MENKSRKQKAKESELATFLAYSLTQKMEAWRQHSPLWSSTGLHSITSWMMILSCVLWLDTWFWLVIGFIGLLKLVTTINYNCFTNLHNLQFITACTKSSQSAVSSSVTASQWLPCHRFLGFHVHVLTGWQLSHTSSWPLTTSHVWPPLAMNRYHRLALTPDLSVHLSQN
jgi:hypothetical protein